MGFKNHFQLKAKYNQRLNSQIFAVAMELTPLELKKNMGAFFGSVIGTLNHVIVGDILWLSRFQNHSEKNKSLSSIALYPSPTALHDILFDDINNLYKFRVELDKTIIEWVSETDESDFEEDFVFGNSEGLKFCKNFGQVVAHLFNHHTHHRGQVSTLLNQFGKDIGVADFIVDIPDS